MCDDVRVLGALVDDYIGRIANLNPPERYQFRAATLLNAGPRIQAEWAARPGVYAFLHNREVVYIGRAAKDSLATRLWDQVRPRKGEWHELVKQPDTEIELYAFESSDWYWVASLELFLLQAGKPRFNTRRC